jgi:hypothetical protein
MENYEVPLNARFPPSARFSHLISSHLSSSVPWSGSARS